MRANNRRIAAAALALVLVVGGFAAWAWSGQAPDKGRLALFTSLPIYWSESASLDEMLDGPDERHWVRVTLEEGNDLVPLDTLDARSLAGTRKLIMAQPRPLAPMENVALDQWVRDGGQLLLFADPLLTEESRFALGDKRRPQDVVLLSPILRRWGLELTFDENQPAHERRIAYGSVAIPVHFAGSFTPAPAGTTDCTVAADSVIAHCSIGAGTVLVVADAALLESDRDTGDGAPPLGRLLDVAFTD